MQISGATELASKGQGLSDSSNVKIKGEIDDSLQSSAKIRCLCGSSLETDDLIKVKYPTYLSVFSTYILFNSHLLYG